MSRARQIIEKVQQLRESPAFLYNYNVALKDQLLPPSTYIMEISQKARDETFNLLFKVDNQYWVGIKDHGKSHQIICAFVDVLNEYTEQFDSVCVLQIKVKKHANLKPKGISKIIQIESVSILKGYDREGIAKKVYSELMKKNDLVSDVKHLAGGFLLWNSLAGDPNVYIYAYHIDEQEWIKDEKGKRYRYSKNTNFPEQIADPKIWGPKEKGYNKIVTVATLKDLNK